VRLADQIRVLGPSLTKVLLYGLEAAILCFIGLWLFFETMSTASKLIVSGIFGAFVILVGFVSALIAAASTAQRIERKPNK
jgi:hypothetical protein